MLMEKKSRKRFHVIVCRNKISAFGAAFVFFGAPPPNCFYLPCSVLAISFGSARARVEHSSPSSTFSIFARLFDSHFWLVCVVESSSHSNFNVRFIHMRTYFTSDELDFWVSHSHFYIIIFEFVSAISSRESREMARFLHFGHDFICDMTTML